MSFTIVVPIRWTELEKKFIKKSLVSAIKLHPSELIIGTDGPLDPHLANAVKSICAEHDFDKYKIITVDKNPDWNFQLANVIFTCYNEAKYDKILSFDVDSELRAETLIGLNLVGKDNVAVCSFTKKLLIKNYLDLQRYIFYRIRVYQSDYVFSGVYWVYRPHFMDIIDLDEYKEITNGVDTYLTNKIRDQNKYKIITRKEKGCNCMDIQNEDYPWRQFQTGVWIGANNRVNLSSSLFKPTTKNMSKIKNSGIKEKIEILAYSTLRAVFTNRFVRSKRALLFVVAKAMIYGHPHIISGYNWALKNPNDPVVQYAKNNSYAQWNYSGGKLLKNIGKSWDRSDGTGF